MPTNDNDREPNGLIQPRDPYGAAALLLVESLIHGLCERAALRTDQAVEIVERAASVQADHADADDDNAALLWQSHHLLKAIAASLAVDGRPDAP